MKPTSAPAAHIMRTELVAEETAAAELAAAREEDVLQVVCFLCGSTAWQCGFTRRMLGRTHCINSTSWPPDQLLSAA